MSRSVLVRALCTCTNSPAQHVSRLLSAVSASASQLGGKGANLCEMAKCGVNVPPGLTITTEVCEEFYRVGECCRWLLRQLQ
jgi:hypothetical protein